MLLCNAIHMHKYIHTNGHTLFRFVFVCVCVCADSGLVSNEPFAGVLVCLCRRSRSRNCWPDIDTHSAKAACTHSRSRASSPVTATLERSPPAGRARAPVRLASMGCPTHSRHACQSAAEASETSAQIAEGQTEDCGGERWTLAQTLYR